MNKRILIPGAIIVALLMAFFLINKPIAERYNEKGVQSYISQDFPQAEQYFKKALFWKSRSPEILINMIKVELAQDKIEKTSVYIKKLSKHHPDLPDTYGLKGQVLVVQKKYDQAIPLLTLAIENDSSLAYAYYYRGISRANLNDLEGAAEDYLKAQQLDKGNIEALEERAVILTKMKDFDALIENYNAIIALDPSNTNAFLERGNFKLKITDYENAIADYSHAIKLDDKLGEAYFNRGKSYAFLERFENAQIDFDKAAQLNYKKPGAYYNAGLASLKLGNTSQANTYLNKVLQLKETEEYKVNALYLLGVLEMMKGNNKKAIDYFTRSIDLDSEYADAYYNRGIAYGLSEKHIEALSDLERCVKIGKRTADIYFAMGVQRIALNNFPAGCSDLKTAVEMGSDKAAEMRKQYCKQY
jgi:tetratricopeptide (TPR) repeat protein